MTTYYSFQQPIISPDLMDPNHRVPDDRYRASIAGQVRQSLNEPKEEIVPVCTKAPPCKTFISWKPTLSECPTTFMSWHDLTDGKINGVEIGQKDSRIWVSNLDSRKYGRGVISGAEWWSESTQPHIRNRQLFVQYLNSTKYPKSSPHEKRIENVDDTYVMLQHKYGNNAIQYTTF